MKKLARTKNRGLYGALSRSKAASELQSLKVIIVECASRGGGARQGTNELIK